MNSTIEYDYIVVDDFIYVMLVVAGRFYYSFFPIGKQEHHSELN